MGFGVYIHWPFCLSKCPYCDFYKEVKKNVPQEEIVAEYKRELDFYYQYTSENIVNSIFFGGGTPSLMKPENVAALIDYVAGKWKTAPEIEISLEANPNSDYPEMFADLRRAGINRLSLGVQALNDADLRFLGRTHNLKQAYQAIDGVLQNFDNHSLDLIYARPQQKLSDWEKELAQAASFGMKHLSLYQLTIEEGTVFARKGIKALDEDAAGEMYLFTEDYLADKGIYKYEVSNYSRPGYASRHNLLYWTGQDYIGVGVSAHGRFCFSGFKGNLEQKRRDRKISRTSLYAENFSPLVSTLSSSLKPEKMCFEGNPEQKRRNRKYYASTYNCQLEELSQAERAEELLLMGLRLTDGIDKRLFAENCGLDFDGFIDRERLKYLCEAGLLVDTPQNIRATREGFLVLNGIIEQLCP